MKTGHRLTACFAAAGIGVLTASSALAETTSFVPPPRTIADITAILDQQKPDPKLLSKLRALADASAPTKASRASLSSFYYDRGIARVNLGRNRDALGDALKAVEYGRGNVDSGILGRLRALVAAQYLREGDPKGALPVLLQNVREVEPELVRPGSPGRGWLFGNYNVISQIYLTLGDATKAAAYVRRNQDLLLQSRSWPSYNLYRLGWQLDVQIGQARLQEARGNFADAEAGYRRAEITLREWVVKRVGLHGVSPASEGEANIDQQLSNQGRMKAAQGRLVEGEADVRKALLSRLRADGKYNTRTAGIVFTLANMMAEQGRYAEAEKLIRTTIEIYRTLGVSDESQILAASLNQLGSILNLQGRWNEAAQTYGELEQATRNWEAARRDAMTLDTSHIATLYNTNNLTAGIAVAERLLAQQKSRFGDQNVETALAQGTLAIGLAKAGRDAEAMSMFKAGIPALMLAPRATDVHDAIETAAREQRTLVVAESYIALLARSGAPNAAIESFRLADRVRSRSVQKALAASSARAVARNPVLSDLVRQGQDLDKQLSAQLGLLNNLLALSPAEREDKDVKALQTEIDRLRVARDTANRDIASKFRDYASLVEPQPPTADEIRTILRPDEAFLSFYFGREVGFVWALPKNGPVMFAAVATTAGDIEHKISRLREALEPNAAIIADIPPFDLALAHDLYALLLKPTEAGWRPAKSLIVATNGALGLLPLGLLPTTPAELKADAGQYFAGYREVAWLARTHAVTLIPSASALKTLRQLPPGSEKRERMIGFGDPLFSKEQAAALLKEESPIDIAPVSLRGLPFTRRATPQTRGVDSAQIGLLPRLPDTADELRSVALALQADPAKVLNLGKAANEQVVKTTDLSKYRVIVFATHGLVPGDLNGLTQPALALTAPEIAGVPGDGLLTMEEILTLKLQADWVVLSACNTGAGSGAGAEAASGLGRAFFYAGTRAILVTNWSVHSASARQLVTDLFRRQQADSNLTRGEALRQASMALLDGPGFEDGNGKTLFTYGHPLFWAPYTIIGDGG